MSDGIIQETFNQFRAKRLGKSITHSETLTLERELIEKITLLHPIHDINSCSLCQYKKYLIGDNND